MTHVVHPYAFRIGALWGWKSRWFRTKNYQEFLKSDLLLRQFLEKKLRGLSVADLEVERSQNDLNLIIKTSRPGLIIGRGGEGIEKLKRELQLFASKKSLLLPKNFKISIEEVRAPESYAKIAAQLIATDLEKRLPFRRVLRQNVEKIMASKEVKGAKITLSGRLDGSEMARYEWLKKGRLPLTTFRANIDFARERARLPYGDLGIKVWIYKGEVFEEKKK